MEWQSLSESLSESVTVRNKSVALPVPTKSTPKIIHCFRDPLPCSTTTKIKCSM